MLEVGLAPNRDVARYDQVQVKGRSHFVKVSLSADHEYALVYQKG